MRMKKVLQSRLALFSDNVYIQIKTKEKLDDQTFTTEKTNLFTEDLFGDGEINEFIWKQQKDSLLIHGQAGSGKSTAARKIEEFLWIFYQKNKIQENYIPLIPIFVSLPQLRDPVYSAIEETLKSDNYRFNERQIKEFQEAIENKKFKLIIIMDSYDELKADFIGLNLNVSNKISKWSCLSDKNKYPKIITTCRTEVFSIAGYNTWFLSESNNPQYFKEIKLLKFNQEQIQLYIEQYTQLCVKRDIREIYFNSNTNQDFSEFELFFSDLSKTISNVKTDTKFMLNEGLIQQILYKCSSFVTKDLQKSLVQLLQEIWSSQQYFKFIQIMKLEKVIETPFMAEIVMAVLPYIVKQRQEINNLEDKFIKRYIYFGKNDQTIIQKSQLEKQALDEWQTIINNHQFMAEYQSEFSEIQVEKIIFKYFSGSQRFYIIKNALKLEPLSTYDFYGQFLEHYFKRQIYKLRETGELVDYEQIGGELWKFTHNLANEMTFKNMTQVYFQPSGLIFKKTEKDWRDEFFNDDCQEGVYKKLFRKCMPIKQKNGIYSFNHKSLQEFLVAKWFVEFLTNLKIPLDEQVRKTMITYQFFEFAWSFEYLKGPIKFIADKLRYNEELKQKLLALVELTKTDDSMIIGGSNSLLLLNEMDHSFIDMNLSGIKIQDVTLSGANFFNCDFTNSTFKGITLSSVNLNLAKIINASWTDLYLDQLPKISTQLNNIESLTYIEKEKLMLAIDDKQQIKLYDTYKVQESNLKLAIEIQPKFAILSNNGRFLALVNQQEVVIYDLQDWKTVQKIRYGVIYEQDPDNKPQGEQQQFRGCCTFGADDQSLIFGGPKGAYEMKITIQLVERGGQKKVSDKEKKKGKGKVDSKHDLEEKVEIVQQQPNVVMQKDQFKQIISEQVIALKSCKVIVMQHASKSFTIFDSQLQVIKSIDSKFRKVTCLDANNELNLIAIGSGKGEINLFYLSQIEQPISFSGHKDAITELRFQKDGKTFVSCSYDQSIILWSTQQQSQINQANFTTFTKIFSLALVSNSYLAVTGQNNGLLQIWDLNSQDTSLSNIQGHTNKIQCCIFSSDGSFLVSGSDDLLIKLWNTQTGQQIGQNLEKHQQPILCLSLTQDMSLLCSGGADGFLYLWDLSNYKIKQTINLFGTKIKQVQIFWSEDSYKILSLTDEKLLHLWDESNLSQFTLIYDYQDEKKRLIPYLDQSKLLELSIQSKVQIIKSYNLTNFNLTNQIITALAISFNGLQKLIGTNKGYLFVIENKKQVFFKQAHKGKVDIIFVLNSQYFITTAQNAISFWRFSDFTIQSTFKAKFNKIYDYFVSNDNLYILIDHQIRVFNISQYSTIKVIKEKKKENITSLCLKNNTLYGGTQNGRLLIIDLSKSEQYQVILISMREKQERSHGQMNIQQLLELMVFKIVER
ncbi:hypothetical protein FGO68_gene15006 [Halteria grandinella]|uniref:NACHT domain-containing protein n=1 Tax=Halteria grandinella TaxID=5974 RepID=A0A8J8SXY2_HALGN|nr:hypothetical protein FGO68_gene15006 [Halteria grandinella]